MLHKIEKIKIHEIF